MIKLPAKKSLGQHFLIDPNAHARIAEALDVSQGDWIIEVGPGTGLLTSHLLKTSLEKLIAFELDKRAVPLLREQFERDSERLEIREQDFLDAELDGLAQEAQKKLLVVGNIPYYITTPILFKLIDERASVRRAVLLIQREVADRLTAEVRTKAYGIPTVLANFFAEVRFLFSVPRGAFRPIPSVDSAVVSIDFEREFFARNSIVKPENFDESRFRTFVRALFAARRKTVRNNLKAIIPDGVMNKIANENGDILNQRAEELTIPAFLELFLLCEEYKHCNS